MREQTQFNHALSLMEGFDFSVPFHHYIKGYFRLQKQLGSRDRRTISSLCYNYLRVGKSFGGFLIDKKMALSCFLLDQGSDMQEFLSSKYLGDTPSGLKSIDEKINFLSTHNADFSVAKIFPFEKELSNGIDHDSLLHSYLTQPEVWIRVRKNYLQQVITECERTGLKWRTSGETINALAFPSSTGLTELNSFKKGWFEIQDLSSQQTLSLLPENLTGLWWDCCSGAGGKSLALSDMIPGLKLKLTDVRKNILQNARERFQKAGLKNASFHNMDVTSDRSEENSFDGIIADVPCTGSGTWARTPESVWNFKPETIREYAILQQKILSNIIPSLKTHGVLLFITCSVFKDENENNVTYMTSNYNLEVVNQKLIIGQNEKADNLFACLLKKR